MVILVARSVDPNDLPSIRQTADELKTNGVYLVTVLGNTAYDTADNATVDALDGIASSLQCLEIQDEDEFLDALELQFDYANCRCPTGTKQVRVLNSPNMDPVFLADCLWSPQLNDTDGTPNSLTGWQAERFCESVGSGSLVSITAQEKLDFVVGEFLNESLSDFNEVNIGLNRPWSGESDWYYYDYQYITLGSFGNFTPPANASVGPTGGDRCGILLKNATAQADMFVAHSANYTFQFGPCNVQRPMICQIRAVDASRYSADYRKIG